MNHFNRKDKLYDQYGAQIEDLYIMPSRCSLDDLQEGPNCCLVTVGETSVELPRLPSGRTQLLLSYGWSVKQKIAGTHLMVYKINLVFCDCWSNFWLVLP